MADIFISYAKEDRSRVEPFANALAEQGWSVFWDRDIPGGKTWDEVIEEELDVAKCVIVVWSKISISSRWVRAEAEEGLKRNILVPVSIEDIKIPLLFRPIQAVRLINWQEDSSHPQFVKLISDLSSVLGSSPLKAKEAEIEHVEEESKRKAEEQERRAENERKAEQEPKLNEERRRIEAEAKRKAEAERKRKEEKAKRKPDKPEPEASAHYEPKSSAPRKSSIALKLGVVAGVIVLLIIGIWLYISKPTSPSKARTAEEQAAKAQKKVETRPGHIFSDKLKVGGRGPVMIILAAGNFLMGSPDSERNREDVEGPQHSVTISRKFALSIYEVTFAEYDIFAEDTGRQRPDDEGWGRGNRPVINVSWEDAKAYARWLSEQTGQQYRLPTEAEWEYSARAGSTTAYSFGDDPSRLGEYTWFWSNSGRKSHPVGEKPPNEWGLYDMHGNVREWCQGLFGYYSSNPVVDPEGPDSGKYRVLRGGSWGNDAKGLRSANRDRNLPINRLSTGGFRVARYI
jgi:formylglycine-generating enzyme required for sulfatase activity